MILPSKHVQPERALVGVGAEIICARTTPMTMSRKWDEIRGRRTLADPNAPLDYEWFVLALDFLVDLNSYGFSIFDRRDRLRTWHIAEGCEMIRHLGSDLPSFKTLSFRPGLNILVADKSEGATDRQSRNGAGESSLVELIHFLLGAEVRPESMFRSSKLADHSFDILFDEKYAPISASRSGKRPSRIVVDGNFSGWPIRPVGKSSGFTELTNETWKENLVELRQSERIEELAYRFSGLVEEGRADLAARMKRAVI
jgi:hypothetical protein